MAPQVMMFQFFLFLLIVGLIHLPWYLFFRRKFEYLGTTQALLNAGVLSLATIYGLLLLLGAVFKELGREPVLGVFVVFIVLFTTVQLKGGKKIFPNYSLLFKESFREFPLLHLTSFFVLVIFLSYSMLFPPTGFDDYVYHLPFIEMTLQMNSVQVFPFPDSNIYAVTYPKAIELLMAFPALLFKNLALVMWLNVYLLLLTPVSVYCLCRSIRVNVKRSVAASLMSIFVPGILLLVTTVKTDFAYSFFIFTSIYYSSLLLFGKNSKHYFWNCILFSVCTMFLLASKPTGLLHASLIVLITFLSLKFISQKNKKELLLFLATVGAVTLLGASYWYVRNFIYYGNPIYPVPLSFFGVNFPGSMKLDSFFPLGKFLEKNALSKLLHNWREIKGWAGYFYIHDGRFNGLGPVWTIIFLPSTIFCLYLSSKFKQWRILFIQVVGIFLFLVTPFNWYARYTLFITSFGAVAFAFVSQNISPGKLKFINIISNALVVWVFASVIQNNFMDPYSIKKQIKALKEKDFKNRIISYKDNELKHLITQLGNVSIGFNAVCFYSALKDYHLKNKLYFIEGDLNSFIREKKLAYIFVNLNSPVGNYVTNSNHFKLIYETHSCVKAGLFEIL